MPPPPDYVSFEGRIQRTIESICQRQQTDPLAVFYEIMTIIFQSHLHLAVKASIKDAPNTANVLGELAELANDSATIPASLLASIGQIAQQKHTQMLMLERMIKSDKKTPEPRFYTDLKRTEAIVLIVKALTNMGDNIGLQAGIEVGKLIDPPDKSE